jgi:hypothetical protein
MFIVVDLENEEAVGPFDSEDEAKAYFVQLSHEEGWYDVEDLIFTTGSPFGTTPQGEGLALMKMSGPDEHIRASIVY